MELKLISMCCKLANSDDINEQIGTELSLCKEVQADIHEGGRLPLHYKIFITIYSIKDSRATVCKPLYY